MLSEIILVLSIIHIVLYLFVLEYKSIKFIQDINYDLKEYNYFYKWFYIKNTYNLLFIINIFINNIYINILNILLVYLGVFVILKYKNIIKFKITKRIIILFISLNIINILIALFLSFYYVLLLFPLINSFNILINKLIDNILNRKYFNKAKKKINNLNPFVISITGSSGKTSVKNIIYDLISDKYICFKTKKSFNTLKGIEISINNIKDSYKKPYLVLEVGAKRKNDIKKICKLIKSDIAIITNILPQHLKTFKSIDNIIKEKSNIIWSLKENGIVVLNKDDSNLNNLIEEIKLKRDDIRIFTYSLIDKNSDLYAYDINYSLESTSFKIVYNKKDYEIRTKLLGKHSVYNLLCSILVSIILKNDILDVISDINKINYIDNRLEYKRINNMIILDDSYNSNINGFFNAIDTLLLYKGKKYLISPGIVETDGDEINERIALYLRNLDINVLLIDNKCSKIYQEILNHNTLVFKSFKEAYNYALNISKNEEICVLIENDLTDNYFL